MADLEFQYVSHAYDEVTALVGLQLHLASGELVAVVGASGCGKSTALRLAAGLEIPDHGAILCDGENITGTRPNERHFGMVTQQNALTHFRDAGGNISFPLQFRNESLDTITDRVQSEADQFSVGHLLQRRRHQLSGGEIQAVQLARALVARPRVLLLDEPLARIDLDLRLKLRADIARVQRAYGVTTLLVTADQEDAMVLADRVAVLDRGRLQQVGTPMELYDQPVNVTVASFLGEPAMNILSAPVITEFGQRQYVIGGRRFPAHPPVADRFVGANALVGIRPEQVIIERRADERLVPATVTRSEIRGSSSVVVVETEPTNARHASVPAAELKATVNGIGPRPGDTVGLSIDPGHLHLFDTYTEAALAHPVR